MTPAPFRSTPIDEMREQLRMYERAVQAADEGKGA